MDDGSAWRLRARAPATELGVPVVILTRLVINAGDADNLGIVRRAVPDDEWTVLGVAAEFNRVDYEEVPGV